MFESVKLDVDGEGEWSQTGLYSRAPEDDEGRECDVYEETDMRAGLRGGRGGGAALGGCGLTLAMVEVEVKEEAIGSGT